MLGKHSTTELHPQPELLTSKAEAVFEKDSVTSASNMTP
jgi:hypothetical protein